MYPTNRKSGTLLQAVRSAHSKLKGLIALTAILLCSMCWGSISVQAAPDEKVHSQTVTLNVHEAPLKQVISQIESQTGYLFVVNDNVDTQIKVSIKSNKENVSKVLNRILKGKGIYYAIEGTNIVLSKNERLVKSDTAEAPAREASGSITRVSGQVMDNLDEPAIGASVRVKGETHGVATDIDGNFVLTGNFKPDTELEITYVGMKPVYVKVGDGRNINVTLVPDANTLDEMVVVGYGTQKRVNLTGAVSTVDVNKQLESRPITSVAKALQGSAPGLNVTSGTGRPGDTSTLSIRGVLGSINGSTSPLILVDNVEVNNLDVVNPDDIESISVLKDAASSSIYGIKGAFGVVLITTKKAKAGEKFTVSYSNNFAWKQPTVIPELAIGSEGATLALLGAQRSKGVTGLTNDVNMYWDWESIERMKEWERVYGGYNLSPEFVYGRDYEKINGRLCFYRSWDPYSTMMKKNSFQQTHNFSINGSSGKTSYNVGLGYLGFDGIVKVNNDKQNRYNVSFGTQTQLKDWFQFHTKMMYTRTDTQNPYEFNTSADEWYYLYRWPALYPIGGTLNGEPIRSAYSERAQANMNKITDNWMRINLGAQIDIYKGLSLEADYTFTHVGRYTQTNGGQATGYDFWGGDFSYGTWTTVANNRSVKASAFSDFHVFNALLRYKYENETYGDVSAYVGTNIESYNDYGNTSARQGLVLTDRPEISLATGDQTVSSYNNKNTLAGIFGRVNYDFRGRYLIEANLRYDGSSKFPAAKQWALFPSFSAGWIVSNEKFMQNLNPTLSFLKIRGSWGKIGSQNISANMFRSVMDLLQYNWIINGDYSNSFGMPKALEDGFTWEKVTTTDFGFDLRLFNSTFGVSFDWFNRRTSDLISSGASLPSTFGQTPPMTNYGHLDTKGWELSVDYHYTFPYAINMTITANVSDATGKYSNVNPTERRLDYIYNGKTYGEIWGFETERLFTHDDFTWDESGNITGYAPGVADQSAYEKWYGSNFFFGPGDVKYKDLNGDGFITNSETKDTKGTPTLDNHGDLKVIGNTTPRYQYGARLSLEWNGLDFSIFFQGVGKRDYWGNGQMVIPGWHFGEAYYEHHLDYWTEDNPDAFYPRPWGLNYAAANPNFQPQSRYLLDMSYVRLKNLTFGYSLPQNILRKAYLTKVRFYASFENLKTWDKLNGIPIDPESRAPSTSYGYIGRTYPFSKEFSFGVQLSF